MNKVFMGKNVRINESGYPVIWINKTHKRVHRLVLKDELDLLEKEFPDVVFHVHHIDGNKLNYKRENLEILTPFSHLSDHHKTRVPTKKQLLGLKKGRENNIPNLINRNKKRAIYNWLLNTEKVDYDKRPYINNKNNPKFTFRLRKINKKNVNIGGFIEPISPEIIYDLIMEEL